MKKVYYIIIMCLSVLISSAQTIGEAFYIYRNDGHFNAFFRDEVDSIAYSNYDADSLYYDEVVTQLVYTQDSLYRIPIAAIDSVGFVQLETIYKKDITILTNDLFDYVISAEGTILTLSSQTPASLLPTEGEKLVAVELSDVFPYGFLGKALRVYNTAEGYRVECEQIGLEEAVDQLCVTTIAVAGEDETLARNTPRKAKWEYPKEYRYEIGEWKASFDLSSVITKKDVLTYSGRAGVEVSVNPTVIVKMVYVVDTKRGLYVKGHIEGDTKGNLKLDVAGEVNKDLWKKALFSRDLPLPFGFTFYAELGGKVEASGELAVGVTFNARARQTLDITYCPNNASLNSVSFTPEFVSSGAEWDYVAARASLKACAYLDLGIGYAHHGLAKVGGEFELGAKGEFETVLDLDLLRNAGKNTACYEHEQNINTIDVNAYLGAYFVAALMSGAESVLDENALERLKFSAGRDWNLTPEPIFQGRNLPLFEDTDFSSTGSDKAEASATVSGDCILPSRVGLAVLDNEGERVGTYYRNGNYWNHYLSDRELRNEFSNLAVGKTYTVHPLVNWLGYEILALPSKELKLCPVTLSDFKVTKLQHQVDAFYHEGNYYDYRFDVSVTATLDNDTENVEDWGYMYQDPWGNEPAKISLMEFGNSYTDSRWAYFRNEPQSTCTLYGYVKYMGSDEPEFCNLNVFPLEYSCPDDNHPHWIDLGLPSGTQWRCCNEGASVPEACGGYYEFGKISTAPTLEQIQELLNYTTSSWTTKNGMNGYKFTGPSGVSIFLPAASWRFGGIDQDGYYGIVYDFDIGVRGLYWSATPYGSDRAYGISFQQSGVELVSPLIEMYIPNGLSVRPVR